MDFSVLGASGYIGGELVRTLHAHEDNTVYTPLRQDITTNVDKILARDLGHVFYCIGLTANFRDHPFNTVEAHVCLLKRILEQGCFKSLTYLSSTRVYEAAATTHESTLLQVSPENPDHLYNLSKLTGESLCLASGQNIKIARIANVFGCAMSPKNFIYQILREAVDSGTVRFLTAASSAKDYVCVNDVVHWLTQIALHGKHTIYNVASGNNTSNADIALLLKNKKINVSYVSDAPQWSFQTIDTRRLVEEFGAAQSSLLNEFEGLLCSLHQEINHE